MKRLLLLMLILGAGAAGYFAGHRGLPSSPASADPGRRVLFYQSPMHPWIKSDKPGNCTICGMKLVAVYEGQKGSEGESDGTEVHLGVGSINAIHVETTRVGRQPLRRSVRVAGVIEDDDSTHRRLSAYVDGRIEKLTINYVGAEVLAGQPLARLYSRALLTVRDEYLLLWRQTTLPQREQLLDLTRRRLVRMGLSSQQVDELPGLKTHPDYVEILAPISGTVVERKVYEGQYVKEGDVLFEIADFSTMWFVFDAYERDLAWLRMGQIVEVSTPAVPGKVFRAAITFIDPNLKMESRTAKIRVVLENPHVGDPLKHRHEILHKVFAEGVVRSETPETLVVPRSAVLSPGSEPLVFVVKGPGRYQPQRVRLGRAGDEYWEILAGLEFGQEIVTTGNLLLDAQSQLDRGTSEQPLLSPAAELTDAQRSAATDFLTFADALSQALSSDDLAAFNREASKLPPLNEALTRSFSADVQKITELGVIPSATSLAEARKNFYGFSMASARFGAGLRARDPAFSALKVFECPMAKAAVPSASLDKGQWIQLAGPLRNPFFGKEMLDCGSEVKIP